MTRMARALKTQKAFIRQELHPVIQDTLVGDGTFGDADFRKIKGYYGMGVPAYLGTAFGLLRGRPITPAERMCLTMQGAVTGLVDDLFDKDETPISRIEALTLTPDEVSPENDRERLICAFQGRALNLVPNAPEYMHACRKVLEAQEASLAQTQPGISEEDLRTITFEKGGVSLQFYRQGLAHELGQAEADFAFQIGALLQLENDVFDAWKDSQEGVKTLATEATSVALLRNEYIRANASARSAALQLPFKERQTQGCLRYLDLITSMGLVCLQHLEAAERLHGTYDTTAIERGGLVCDMSKFQNLWRWAKVAPKMHEYTQV